MAGRPPERIVVFTDLVAPVLASNCVSCHGPVKVEGGLRLDTADGVSKGGDDGKVVTAGRAASSELVRRIFLPESHEDAMPPKGHRTLSPADAALVRWWVDAGARFDLTLEEAEIAPEILPAVEALTGPLQRGGPTLPTVAVADASPGALALVKAEGFSVARVADGRPFLHVHSTNAASRITDASLRALTGDCSAGAVAGPGQHAGLRPGPVRDRDAAQPHAAAPAAHRGGRRRAWRCWRHCNGSST